MEIFYTKKELQLALEALKLNNKVITLIPTMGALHEGHLSLINFAKPKSDVTVCSIFVNPTQFNDPKDLEKYPRPIEKDIALLESVECDILFLPTVEEMYPSDEQTWDIDLGNLDKIWEGEHRPGHFQGVTQIVHKLFDLVKPDYACFGQKDFQQVMVIQKMIEIKKRPVQLLICPIIRNEKGLALSSRNARLSDEGLEIALTLYKSLNHIKSNFHNKPIPALLNDAKEIIASKPELTLEYLSICESSNLTEATAKEEGKSYVAILAAWLEGVRLIDNIILS